MLPIHITCRKGTGTPACGNQMQPGWLLDQTCAVLRLAQLAFCRSGWLRSVPKRMLKPKRLLLRAAKQQMAASQMRRTGEHRMGKQVGVLGTEAGMAGTAVTETGQSRATENEIETGCQAGLTGDCGTYELQTLLSAPTTEGCQVFKGQKLRVLANLTHLLVATGSSRFRVGVCNYRPALGAYASFYMAFLHTRYHAAGAAHVLLLVTCKCT